MNTFKNNKNLYFVLVLGKSGKRFQYRIKVPKAETLFLAIGMKLKDRSNGWNCSKLIHDDFELNLVDQCGETAFIMKMNSKWTYTLNKLHVSEVAIIFIVSGLFNF